MKTGLEMLRFTTRRNVIRSILFVVSTCLTSHSWAVQSTQSEFFESRIRPVLIEHCYACHNSVDQPEADYSLDWMTGIRAKTDHGQGVVPGDPDASLLLKVIGHEIEGLEMPDGGAKLSPEVIADFHRWIADGAVDPRDKPPSEMELKESISWEATLESRKKWWSFQPIQDPELPAPSDWSDHPVDRFVFQSMQPRQLQPNPPADTRILVRRLSFAILGLPPTPDQTADVESGRLSIELFVDQLLASPQFGEHWARHWMDLVRYADTHGSEGDPAIPNAYQYRDYLIRAFNSDVSYRQLAREHIAGDLLDDPRINPELGVNESAIGPAHWRLCFHGFAPTDALDEKVRFTDDQINVFGKTFLGLTISCARCHDHKFDAISQSDYYSLFGILGSCRPATKDVTTRPRQLEGQKELEEIKQEIRNRLAEAWLSQTSDLADRLLTNDPSVAAIVESAESPTHSLHLWKTVAVETKGQKELQSRWQALQSEWAKQQSQSSSDSDNDFRQWDLANKRDFDKWYGEGGGKFAPTAAGEFTVGIEGEQVVSAIYPAGLFTNILSDRHRGVLGSPSFQIGPGMTAWMYCVGGGQATARYVVQNYPRSGTVYPIKKVKNRRWHWQKFDLDYWQGDDVHLEIVTAKDAPLQTRNSDRSWFGIRDVVVRKTELGPPSSFPLEFRSPLFEAANDDRLPSRRKLADYYARAVGDAIKAWKQGDITDAQALFLNALVRDSVLPNKIPTLPGVQKSVQSYRERELEIPAPFRVPGLWEADASDQALFERGDHRKPKGKVRRRFLEAIDPSPYHTRQSGRLELANDLFRSDNPLTARVIANRIWLKLFGRGLVSTPDNFGRLGAKPTHPELLDYLATRMVKQEWSIKKMIRLIVLSRTWQQSSTATLQAMETDPDNQLLSRFELRRLDAEAIRDTMVSVSSRLSSDMYGPGFAPNSLSKRRAVYVLSKRNNLDKFLATFNSPVPFATTGKRATTNVPAQSLTLLNSSFVIELANDWATQIRTRMPSGTDTQRIRSMFETAIGRTPDRSELEALRQYLTAAQEMQQHATERRDELQRVLSDEKDQLRRTVEPIREKLIRARMTSNTTAQPDSLVAHWDFSKGSRDSVGGLNLTLSPSARFEDGALVLDGEGFALSDPILQSISVRTLEAWVQLNGLNQKGGGVVTIQDLSGHVFDSIVFAEIGKNQWLAGSNNHLRTLTFEGTEEKYAHETPIHLAISFDADGTITGYRNGQPYGKPIRKSGIQNYVKQQTRFALGIRHGNKTARGRMLDGKILEVRVYDEALTSAQIAASFSGQPLVSHADVLAELDPDSRRRVTRLRDSINAREESLLGIDESTPGPHDPLARVAHAIFNLKEFIYIR